MNEKFVPEDWQTMKEKHNKEVVDLTQAQLAKKEELVGKQAAEELALKDQNEDEAILMNAKATEYHAGLEEISGKKLEVRPAGKSEAVQENREAEKFKTWRIVKLNTGLKTAKEFEKALKAAGREIDDYVRQGLKEVEKEIVAADNQEEREEELVDATPAELGLPEGGTLEQIYAAAKKNGLEECSREAGPQSAIQYEDQPNNDYRLIGAESFIVSGGDRRVFHVHRNAHGERFLYTVYDNPGYVWSPGLRFVFVRRKKSELES